MDSPAPADRPSRPPYKPHPLRRVRAFLLTDRVGHTIASTIGLGKIAFWWARRRIARAVRRR
ncbi:MAG: hypothetical protein WAO61_00330 [Solirubrobacterales bacterium]